MRAVYGKEEGSELLSQCLHTTVLNIGNPETAEWAANLFGTEDVLVESEGSSTGSQYSENESAQLQRKTLVTTRELLSMPRINPKHGMSGYFKSPVVESSPALTGRSQYQRLCPWRFEERSDFSWERMFSYLRTSSKELPFQPRDDKQQYLQFWTPEERRALGLNLDEESPLSSAEEQTEKKKGPRASRLRLPDSDTELGLERL